MVNFSARCDVRRLVDDLIRIGRMKGIVSSFTAYLLTSKKGLILFYFVCFWQNLEQPFDVFEENGQFRRAPPVVRVEKMFEHAESKLPGRPEFLLCLLPERKNSDLYG